MLALPSRVTVLEGAPDALTFHRNHVAASIPALIRGAVDSWPALERWKWAYLERHLGDQEFTVAVTPDGRADAPLRLGDAARAGLLSEQAWEYLKTHDPTTMLFVTPCEEKMSISKIASLIRSDDFDEHNPRVHYVQLQNNNLRGEWSSLLGDVDLSFPFARDAFGCEPDAVNVWIGDERSTTSLHKDHYENLYVVVTGKKHFTLYPPTAFPLLYEEPCIPAHYRERADGDTARLELAVDDAAERVPWIQVDPLNPDVFRFPRSVHARPLQVTVSAGEMLYLPALWFHHVQQEPDEEGKCIAVNLWYDMQFGLNWAYYNFMQGMTAQKSRPVM